MQSSHACSHPIRRRCLKVWVGVAEEVASDELARRECCCKLLQQQKGMTGKGPKSSRIVQTRGGLKQSIHECLRAERTSNSKHWCYSCSRCCILEMLSRPAAKVCRDTLRGVSEAGALSLY
eukprot:660875-Pelagomonas_calceolata.AAC.1